MSHFLHFHKDHALTDTGSDAFGELSGEFMDDSAQVLRFRHGLGRPVKSFQLVQSLFKALELDGFHQIINRVHLERIQRESVECRCKNHCRLLRKLLEKFESRHSGHLNIEKNGIDDMAREKLNSLGGIDSGTDDLHAVRLAQ
jgi:hypothetical protein